MCRNLILADPQPFSVTVQCGRNIQAGCQVWSKLRDLATHGMLPIAVHVSVLLDNTVDCLAASVELQWKLEALRGKI